MKALSGRLKGVVFGAIVGGLAISGPTDASALVPQFNWGGGTYNIADTGGTAFAEELSFSTSNILTFFPATDPIFADAGVETVEISTLYFDASDYVSNVRYGLNPDTTANGFRVYDDGGSLLFQADLTAKDVEISGGGGLINSVLSVNLTNVTAGVGYLPGSSPIVDAFLNDGIANISLQFSGNLGPAIEDPDANFLTSTFSGSARAAVPEPATLGLLGVGLIGLGFAARRRRKALTVKMNEHVKRINWNGTSATAYRSVKRFGGG
jgi:hypothetical protein